MKQKEAPV